MPAPVREQSREVTLPLQGYFWCRFGWLTQTSQKTHVARMVNLLVFWAREQAWTEKLWTGEQAIACCHAATRACRGMLFTVGLSCTCVRVDYGGQRTA